LQGENLHPWGLISRVELLFVLATALPIGDLINGQIALTDIGTGAAVGGVLGEIVVRLAPMFGLEPKIDGWREGMFLGALGVLALWVFGELEA
jgi:hypothetical protein